MKTLIVTPSPQSAVRLRKRLQENRQLLFASGSVLGSNQSPEWVRALIEELEVGNARVFVDAIPEAEMAELSAGDRMFVRAQSAPPVSKAMKKPVAWDSPGFEAPRFWEEIETDVSESADEADGADGADEAQTVDAAPALTTFGGRFSDNSSEPEPAD